MNTSKPANERELFEKQLKSCRFNIIIAIVFTLVNVVMLLTGSSSYFLFSLTVPYKFILYGVLLGGYMPASFYEEVGYSGIPARIPVVLLALCIIGAIILGLYLLFTLMSAKKHGMARPADGVFGY